MDELIKALMAQQAQRDSGGIRQELGIYDHLGPEGMRKQTDLGTMDERRALAAHQSQAQMAMIQQQLAQAQKMGEPRGTNYGSVAGNIGGGIGDIFRQIGGGIRTHQLGDQQNALLQRSEAMQNDLLGKQDQGRADYGTARMDAMRELVQQMANRGDASSPAAPAQYSGPMSRPPEAMDPSQLGPLTQDAGWDKPWASAMALRPGAPQQPQRRLGPGGVPLPDPSFYGL